MICGGGVTPVGTDSNGAACRHQGAAGGLVRGSLLVGWLMPWHDPQCFLPLTCSPPPYLPGAAAPGGAFCLLERRRLRHGGGGGREGRSQPRELPAGAGGRPGGQHACTSGEPASAAAAAAAVSLVWLVHWSSAPTALCSALVAQGPGICLQRCCCSINQPSYVFCICVCRRSW